MKTALPILLALSLCAALPARAAGPKLETEDQKTVYAIGLALAQSLQPYNLKPAELELVNVEGSGRVFEAAAEIGPSAKPKLSIVIQRS